jgi:hypothetical protein
MKMPVKESSGQEVGEELSQRKRPERSRFLLQVDRQTQGSYTTLEAAQAAALIIKKNYPIVKVAVYDTIDNSARWSRRRLPHRDEAGLGVFV